MTSGQLLIARSLTLNASALVGGVTINANQQSRVMEIRPGNTVALHGLTLTGGLATGPTSPANYGGAIYNDHATLSLDACTLVGNFAAFGGGIYSDGRDSGNATLNLSGCTLYGNSADPTSGGNGGGINSDGRDSGSATLSLSACTLSGNSSERGGGIYSNGNSGSATLTLENSIVAKNSAPTGPDLREFGDGAETIAIGQNLLSSVDDSKISPSSLPVEITLVADPLLAPLGWYGGPTQTMPPLAGSPAIDAAGTTDPTGTDQRGFPRFVDGNADSTAALDIGAVEAGPVIVVNTAADENDGIAVSGVSLRDALAAAASTPVPGQRIVFDATVFDGDPADTITLSHGQLVIPGTAPEGLVMDASNLPAGVTMDGNQQSRVMEIQPGNTVALHSLTLSDGVASGSSPANRGGAIYNDQSVLTLTACNLSGNSATSQGGGIYNVLATLSLSTCTLSHNSAAQPGGEGGGIYSTGPLVMNKTTFLENFARFAGGGVRSVDSAFTADHCTFADNRAGIEGGGASIAENLSTNGVPDAILTHLTVAGNTARNGGGLFFYSKKATLSNCLVAGNSASAGADVKSQDDSIITPTGTNLLGSLIESGLMGGSSVIVAIDPLLAPLGWYGGPTQTMPPLAGSPAIDAAGTTDPTGTDQRGFPRFVDGDATGGAALDIGAVEAGPVITVNNADDSGSGSLRAAITSATEPDTRIVFSLSPASQPISLQSELVLAARNVLWIDGFVGGSPAVTVSGNDVTRIADLTNGSHVILRGLTLRNGSVPSAAGGALRLRSGSHARLMDCVLTQNQSTATAGAIFVSEGSGLVGQRCLFSENLCGVSNGGGAIYGTDSGTWLSLADCSFERNTSPTTAGAIHVIGGAFADIARSTFTANQAKDGGALRNTNSQVEISHSTFTGNEASDSGAGVYSIGTTAVTHLRHCTLTRNQAGTDGSGLGGGIYRNSGTLTVGASIVSENSAPQGPDIHGTVTVTEGVNLIGDVSNATGLGNAGTHYVLGAPLLAPLGHYGGLTQTMPPLPGSPAIDAAGTVNPGGTDQRGFPRFVNAALDVGAVEFDELNALQPRAFLSGGAISHFDFATILRPSGQPFTSPSIDTAPTVTAPITTPSTHNTGLVNPEFGIPYLHASNQALGWSGRGINPAAGFGVISPIDTYLDFSVTIRPDRRVNLHHLSLLTGTSSTIGGTTAYDYALSYRIGDSGSFISAGVIPAGTGPNEAAQLTASGTATATITFDLTTITALQNLSGGSVHFRLDPAMAAGSSGNGVASQRAGFIDDLVLTGDVVSLPRPYDLWASQNLTGSATGFGEDSGNTGITNGLRYLYGPGGSSGANAPWLSPSGSGGFRFTYHHGMAGDDVIAIVRRSPDLTPGNFLEIYRYDAHTMLETLQPGIEAQSTGSSTTVTDTSPPSGSGFYDLQIELAD